MLVWGKILTRSVTIWGIPPRWLRVAPVLALTATLAAANEAPIIDDYNASSTAVAPGETVDLSVEAHDPDCPDFCDSGCGQRIRADLTEWSATGGTFVSEDNGESTSPYSASSQWQAPAEEGTYVLTVSLSDSGNFLCGGRQTTTRDLDVLVTTVTSPPPVIDSLTAEPVQLFPGETSSLTCSATDPEGEPVTYSWETDHGTVTPGPNGTAEYSAADPGLATVTCTATDPFGVFDQESITLSVTEAVPEAVLESGLVTPQRLTVDSVGDVYVVDRGAGGLTVLNLFSGELVYRLLLGGLRSAAVDWNGDLLVGGSFGAEVLDRRGTPLLALDPGAALGEVADVAVDAANRRYGVLYGGAARVVVFDEGGAVVAAFGSTGDATEQFRLPQGLAASPDGSWVVADGGHGRIKIFDGAGVLQRSFGELGGGAGEFVRLDDVAVNGEGIILATDSFQSWVQTFNPDGSPRETLSTDGEDLGAFRTPAGLAPIDGYDKLLVTSINSSLIQVFRTSNAPAPPAPSPDGELSSLEEVFPDQAVGTQSPPQTVELTNLGDAPLGIRSVGLAGEFRQDNDCELFLDPGEQCTFSIRFAPTLAGPAAGSMTIDTSEPAGELSVALSGVGFVPAGVDLAPRRVGFRDQDVGTVSDPRLVILTNTGTVPLAILGISVSGEFAASDDCPASLAGGGFCNIWVQFAPATVGDEIPGALQVASGAPGSPHAVELEGRAVPAPPRLTIVDSEAEEGSDTETDAKFPVRLTAPFHKKVSVEFATEDESAVESEDYLPVAGSLTFEAGETEKIVAVPIVDDSILEPDEETLVLRLSNATRVAVENDVGRGTILDDELCPGPVLLANPGAEEWPSEGGGLPGWTEVAGGGWRRGTADPDPFDGRAFFSAVTGEVAELRQDVDLSRYSEAISAGDQLFLFEGFLRTPAAAGSAAARVVVELRDETKHVVLDVFDTGELSSPGKWRRVFDVRPAPAGSGWARVRLIASQNSDQDPGEVGFFDALTLSTLRAPTVVVDDLWAYEGDVGLSEGEFVIALACPYYREVEIGYATADGSAADGEDYLATSGSARFLPGEAAIPVPVAIVGDEVDEGHEDLFLDLELAAPPEVVLAADRGRGVIVNDDFCPRGAGYWKNHEELWPTDHLLIGGVEYDRGGIRDLLSPHPSNAKCGSGACGEADGKGAPAKLARELAATKLNLAEGSEPSILPRVGEADLLLSVWPPGTSGGHQKAEILALKDELEAYNSRCDTSLKRTP